MQYTIIGSGIAATEAIKAIRENDRTGKITVISSEPHPDYSRPLISYLLGKKVSPDNLSYLPQNFYQDNAVELVLNKRAAKLAIKKKAVILSDRRRIPFDRLLIATGGRPVIPEIKGRDLKGVFTFTGLADAQEIEKYIQKNKVKHAAILGGGLIGLKATEALMELGIKVTIIELADRILSATFDRKAGAIIAAALEKAGCKLLTDNTITEIRPETRKVREVVLKDKKKISTAMVIIAVGVRPNIDLVRDTPIKASRGILVDSFMRTNIKDIYAAGDCCETKDMLLDEHRLAAIWPAAARQGKIAGQNMSGNKRGYSGSLAMNSVELCGIPTISLGQTHQQGQDYQILAEFDGEHNKYKKLVLKDDRIVGIILVGDIERAGIYTGLIKEKVKISGFKKSLLQGDFGLLSLPKEYRKHLVTQEAAII